MLDTAWQRADAVLDETAVIVALLPEGAVRLRWAHSDELFERPRGWYALAPCAAWAGEDTEDLPRGDPPAPTPQQMLEGHQTLRLPHPSLARPGGCCEHCATAPKRAARGRIDVRPIRIGDSWTRGAERAETQQSKARMRKAFTPIQLGVGVPGGAQLLTAVFEAFLRLNRDNRGLSVDITNMFNDLCRVSFMEDLLESQELLGEDFSDLATYFESVLMEEYVNWFWVESDAKEGDSTPQRGGSVGTWKAVESEEGLQQGSPLACFAAALSGVKCILAARKAMDEFHALSREAPATMSDQQKEAVYKLAATASEATAYLDYAALLSKMAALCKAHLAYVKVCQGRNWLAKPEKSIVTADYYSDEEPRASTFVVPPGPEDSMLSEELNCREGEGVPP